MVPVPQEPVQHETAAKDRVVISGMSGLYPNAHNMEEFADILYNKVNPVSAEHGRWSYQHPEAGQFIGAVPGLTRFDSQFFKVHRKLGQNMDPMARKILEESFKAIYDAGLSPNHLSGKKVGVYIGTCFSETEKACFYVASKRSGFGIAGSSKTMFANRVSYWLNGKGPSHAIDQSCCSSTAAIEEAYKAIIRGECEAAIAGGCSLCLHPQSSIHYRRITKLSADGTTKCYDQNAEGFARSDAIGVLFLQKAQDALRIYGEVVHIKNAFIGLKEGALGPKFGFDRDPVIMANFIKNVYDECGIPPSVVEYVEGFGSADPDADNSELEALAAVFKRDKKDPLLLGSVMSNIGYTEAGSGVTAITKVLLGFHRGELAGNLNFTTPRQDVEAIRAGRVKVLSDNHSFRRSYVAVNGLSTMGVNSHVLLHGNYKPKDLTRYKSSIPHLVTMSARTDSAVAKMLVQLKEKPVDPEQLALLHNIHSTAISGHLGRGYVILDTDAEKGTVGLSEQADYYDAGTRPLVLVYSGMGSQWPAMGAQLMRIPVFEEAIRRCDEVLRPKGLDIVHIITSPDKNIFDNILHSFVGIAAVQIGLTDVLKAVGLVPDFIIGHSVGELGCAYADGCVSAREMILSARARGLVSLRTPLARGAMAAVGLGYQKIKDMCPDEIEVACHNGPDSCTISGPERAVADFVQKLAADNIFAREVPCSNIAYHSRYIADAGPALKKYLSDVIKAPKARSARWLSTSVPADRWDQPAAKMSSAEYHTNNLLSPVLFEETSRLLPSNSVLVEVAPHGLLQAILKRSLPGTCTHVPLTRRDHPDNALNVLDAIGKLYVTGYTPKVSALYPKVEFPVSTGTPFLSNLVHWMHSEKWSLSLYQSPLRNKVASCTFTISIHDDDYSFIRGNVIRGKTVFPYAATLVAVWDTLAMCTEQKKKQMSVQFSDVRLFVQPILHDQRALRVQVNLHRGTGMFEALDGDSVIATGYIVGKIVPVKKNMAQQIPEYKGKMVQSSEIYQKLQKTDYSYSGDFQSISDISASYDKARMVWNNNWTTFIDGLLQLHILNHDYKGVSEPEVIRSLSIDVKEHYKSLLQVDKMSMLEADFFRVYNLLCCGGIMMENVLFRNMPLLTKEIALKSLKFVPRHRGESDVTESLQVYIQIVLENINKKRLNIVDTVNVNDLELSNKVKEILKGATNTKLKFIDTNKETIKLAGLIDVVLVKNLSINETLPGLLHETLQRNAFIINIEDNNIIFKMRPSGLYRVVASSNHKDTRSQLIRWRPLFPQTGVTTITVRSVSDLSLLSSSRANLHSGHTLVILSSYPMIPGLKDLVGAWRKDKDRNQVYLMAMSESAGSQCSVQLPDLDLAYNILNNGVWGGEYYFPCTEVPSADRVMRLQSTHIGDTNLQWVEQPALSGPGIPVTVHYCSLNHHDAKQVMGLTKHDGGIISYAMEFSGVTDSGERVMGLIPSGAASTRVLAIPELLWPVPEHWTLEDAATVPLAYAQVMYSLYIKGAQSNIESILVHCGAGGLGQAAINIGLAKKMRVLTTVSSVKKKRFLLKLFPELNAEDIGNSRDLTFADMVKIRTNGEGCKVSINTVEGALKSATLNVTAFHGTTFDFAQISNVEDYIFGMYNLTLERSYVIIDVSSLFERNVANKLQTYLADGIRQGHVVPLTRVVMSAREAARALRLRAAGAPCGRVLLRLQGSDVRGQPRIVCSPERCHLVVTDDAGCGNQWVKRLVDRGATKDKIYSLTVNNTSPSELTTQKNQSGNSDDLLNTTEALGLINKYIEDNQIESIYVIAAEGKISQKTVDFLDIISRKSCPGLKYFAIISDDNVLGRKTCSSRKHDGLPAIKLILPTTSKMNALCISNMDGIERALRSKESVLIAENQEDGESSILDQIESITGIEIPPDVDSNTTLEALGLSDMKFKAVNRFIRDTYSFYYNEEMLKSLTVDRLKELESLTTECEYQDVEGMENFYVNVGSDELLATTEMVFLPTMSSHSAMRADEFDLSQTFLCIVPGLEGHNKRFRTLSQRLKLPALVLQPGLDWLQETIPEVARRYAQTLINKTQLKSEFYLMGYESGVLVALEMAAILEKNGMTGTVYCIGATPQDFKATLERKLNIYKTEDNLQDAIIQHMFSLMGSDVKHLTDLKKDGSWDEKVEASVRTLIGQVPHSAQYAKACIEAAYSRILQVRNYNIKPFSLQSQIIFIRAYQQQDKDMQMYSKKPVVVYDLKAPISNAAADLRCSNLINRHLDRSLIEAFNEKNICDSFLTNSDHYMQYE